MRKEIRKKGSWVWNSRGRTENGDERVTTEKEKDDTDLRWWEGPKRKTHQSRREAGRVRRRHEPRGRNNERTKDKCVEQKNLSIV